MDKTELTYKTAFADGMEYILVVMAKGKPVTADEGYKRWLETMKDLFDAAD
jgi:hypothetical protein